MKITLTVFAVICVLLAVVAILLPMPPPPKSDATQQAIEDAVVHLGWPFWAHPEPTNDITVSRVTLKVLKQQAEFPTNIWRCAQFFAKTTVIFALVSGVSLFLLSRKVGK